MDANVETSVNTMIASHCNPPLTQEQMERINKNREKALSLLAKRNERNNTIGATPPIQTSLSTCFNLVQYSDTNFNSSRRGVTYNQFGNERKYNIQPLKESYGDFYKHANPKEKEEELKRKDNEMVKNLTDDDRKRIESNKEQALRRIKKRRVDTELNSDTDLDIDGTF